MCDVEGISEAWLGHERSADEGNGVFWRGREVNHQYDKSSQFLSLVREYTNSEPGLSLDIQVSSPLTHLWEIQVSVANSS